MFEHTDEQLCFLARSGERLYEEQLVLRYSRLVKACVRPLFLAGGESEDLFQEGMLGLVAAVREYDENMRSPFSAFAEVCVRNRLRNAVKSAARFKHNPLNHYISLEAPFFDDAASFSLGTYSSPEDLVIGQEKFKELICALKDLLSGFEAKILGTYLKGYSFKEIASMYGCSPKSVDNAVQRVRKKTARFLISQSV